MTLDEKKQKYLNLCHAMQSGVAARIARGDGSDSSPKHLRVGVNSALVDSAALARLLMTKGLITEDEYFDSLLTVMSEEVAGYERLLSQDGTVKVTLA